MEQNKKLAFIDIEANQLNKTNENTTEHFILEYSVFSADKKGVLLFCECNCKHPLNDRLSQLLSKQKNYYTKIKKTEKDAYLELLKISKEYNLVCYGNYDQIILNSAAERYNLEKIELIDFAKEVGDLFELPEFASVSLFQLKTLLKLNYKNEEEHTSFWDAKILKNVYLKIKTIKKIEQYKKYLEIERIRPKHYDSSRYKTNIFLEIPSNYRIFLMQYKHIDFPYSLRKDLQISIKIYDQKFNLVKTYEELIENYKNPEGIEKFNQFKNQFIAKNKNFEKNLFIFDGKLWAKFFKVNKNTFYAPYRISYKLFSSIKLSDEQKIKIVKSFYANGNFNKLVDYSRIISQLNKK